MGEPLLDRLFRPGRRDIGHELGPPGDDANIEGVPLSPERPQASATSGAVTSSEAEGTPGRAQWVPGGPTVTGQASVAKARPSKSTRTRALSLSIRKEWIRTTGAGVGRAPNQPVEPTDIDVVGLSISRSNTFDRRAVLVLDRDLADHFQGSRARDCAP